MNAAKESLIWRRAPARIYNLGSPAAGKLRFGHEERLWAQMGEKMRQTALKIPVFLVNDKQMDVLYPPRMQKCLDNQKAREMLSKYEKDDDLTIDWLEKKAPGDFSGYTIFVAVGLYVSCSSVAPSPVVEEVLVRADRDCMDAQAEKSFRDLPRPHIYLCPERIVEAAHELGVEPQLYLETAYYHELAHALMDSNPALKCSNDDPYLTLWGRTIEESAANWITYTRFQEPDVYLVQKIMASQPLEYRGYLALGEAPLYPLPADVGPSPAEFRRELRKQFRSVMQGESVRPMLFSKVSVQGPPDYASWEAVQKIIQTLLTPVLLAHFGIKLDLRYPEQKLIRLMMPYFQGMNLAGEMGAQVPNRTAWGRVFQWIEYKRKGAPCDPGYVIYWEELALFLLASSVKTSL